MSRFSRALVVGGAVLAAALGLAACSPSPAVDEEEHSIAIGLPGFQMPVTWDPAGGGFGLYFMSTRPVYEALIRWDAETGEFVPWLADEFEYSEDGLTLSIKLREDVTFTDGEHMDADGVVKVLNDGFTREGSYFAREFDGAKRSASVTGEYTLEIDLVDVQFEVGEFELYLPITSPAGVDDLSLFEDGPFGGSGPYLLEEVVPEVSATYVRNPDYRDPEAFDFDTITLKVYDDKVAALNAIKSGQIDAAEMDLSLAAEAESNGLVVHSGPRGLIYLNFVEQGGSFFSGQSFPEMADKRVRQAINLAIDQEAITEQLEGGYGRVSSQPLDPTRPDYVEGGDDRYAYDPERSKELLADAGYAEGFTLKIAINSGAGDGIAARYGPVLEQNLGDVGIAVEWIEYADYSGVIQGFKDGDVMASILTQTYIYSVRTVATWITGTGADFVDEDILETATEFKEGTKSEYEAAQPILGEYLLDEALFVPISHPQQLWVSTPDIDMQLNTVEFFVTLWSFSAAK